MTTRRDVPALGRVRAAVLATASGCLLAAAPATAAEGEANAASVEATLNRYCVTCHNDRIVSGRGTAPSMLVSQLRTAGLALDALDVDHVGEDSDAWERVIRKLEARTMPPVGRPRPDEATYGEVVDWLETELDRAATNAPNPGRRPALHRLSRTEYQNAVRDLLALDSLPKEFDVSTLLPADNVTSGFDNLAELLFVSPSTLERYLAAARKISRLAVGDTSMPPIVDRYQLDRDLIQDGHLDGLPLGTRGGTVIRSHLPADGEYVLTVEFAQAAREEHEVEVSVDGERVGLFSIGGRPLVRGASGVFAFEAEPPVDVRVPSGRPREIAVASCRRPGRGTRAWCGGRGAVGGASRQSPVTLSGPYGVDGAATRGAVSASSPAARRRRPAAEPVARARFSRPGRGATPPVTAADLDCCCRSMRRAARGRFRRGIQRALERRSSAPSFCTASSATRPTSTPAHRIGSVTWSWLRACRSSSGAVFRTTSFSTAPSTARSATRRCSRRRCSGCSPTAARARWSTTSPSSGSTCATSRPRSRIRASSPASTRTCDRHSSARPSCSSTACCARTAASATC